MEKRLLVTQTMEQVSKTCVTAFDNRKTLLSFTVDREKEVSCWEKIERDLEVHMYFCDPYSHWQRGSNENGNGLFREFFSKGTDFSKVSQQEKVADLKKVNNRPKKTLNWKNCWQVFQEAMLQSI